MNFLPFCIIILVWINQHKQSGNSNKILFEKISVLVCRISNLTYCFIFISIHLSFKAFAKNFWEFLILFLIVKVILSELTCTFWVPVEAKTQCLVHLGFSSIFQLVNGISFDLQKLFRYFSGKQLLFFLSFCLLHLQLCFLII